jgi:hypothetical protein
LVAQALLEQHHLVVLLEMGMIVLHLELSHLAAVVVQRAALLVAQVALVGELCLARQVRELLDKDMTVL